MLRRRSESSFPVSLWGSLLLALLALTQPETVRTLESIGGRVVVLPLRFLSALAPSTALGAATDAAPDASARDALLDYRRRTLALACRRPAGIDLDLVPEAVQVIERTGNNHGEPDELVLDRRRADLGDCASFVTLGDVLLGFLAPDPIQDDPALAGLARVELLPHATRGRLPRRVPARVLPADGGPLAFLVEPSSPVDRWPLRCTLLDDPYRAARLSPGEYPVLSSGLLQDPLGALPRDLVIGDLRVFGYRERGGRVLPIGFEVEPRRVASSLDVVTLWHHAEREGEAPRAVRATSVAVRMLHLPVPAAGRVRYLATPTAGSATFRAGAAVLDGARLFGICEEGGHGFAIVAPFGQPGRDWALQFVPSDPAQDPVALRARALGRDGDEASLRILGGSPEPGRGSLFVSAVSRDFPAGALVGAAEIDEEGRVRVQCTPARPGHGLQIHVFGGPAKEQP
ncbi:MAG: hypothetical protein U1F36_04520 [Planctomycetota bacterium]